MKKDKIHTTINIEYNRYLKMIEAAERYGITVENLIKLTLQVIAPKIRKGGFLTGARKYQAKAGKWKKEHFYMEDSEYDIYLDFQKYSRFCLSLIVSIAFDRYGHSLLTLKNSLAQDSYQLNGYLKAHIEYKNYPAYITCWVISEKNEQNEVKKLE
jgi:hypothetical protein